MKTPASPDDERGYYTLKTISNQSAGADVQTTNENCQHIRILKISFV